MLTRTGDAAQASRLFTALQSTNSRLRTQQIAVSTGKNAGSFADIAGEAGLLLRTRQQRSLTDTLVGQNEQVLDRLSATDGALAQLGDIAQKMRSLMVQRLDASTGQLVPLDGEVDASLTQIAGQLNTKLGGRYLFAGSRTDTAPVELPAAGVTTADPSLYYRGDGIAPAVQAEPGSELTYGVTASSPVFANLVAALGQAKAAHAGNDRAGLQSAAALLDSAVSGLAELRGDLGAKAERLDSLTEGQRGSLTYFDDIIGRIEDTDMPTALSQIAQDQASLEAAYLTASRLSQLSLADYLR